MPNTLTVCPGTIALTVTVKDSKGAFVPDGTVVTFITNGGELNRATALTTKGVATNALSLFGWITEPVVNPIYSVVASSGQLVASTNVQEVCGAPSLPPLGPITTPAAGAKPAAVAPTTAVKPSTATGAQIRPPATGSGALLTPSGLASPISADAQQPEP